MSERQGSVRSWQRRAMGAALVLLAGGCSTKDGAPTAPQPANLAVQAQVSNADGASLRVHIFYEHTVSGAAGGGSVAPVTLFDRTFPFGQGTTTLPVLIDISGCLQDNARVPATDGCEVTVDLSLVSGATVLDDQALTAVSLAPGQTTRLPTVLLTPVHSVVVAPAMDTIVVGQTVQLTDTVKDITGQVITGRTATWTTSDATAARVDGTGAVTGVAASATPVTITATTATHSGSASIVVQPKPMLKLTPDTVRFAVTQGGPIPATQTVQVTNVGGGALQGLSVAPVAYNGTSSGWLQATLQDSTITLAILKTNLPLSTDTALVIVSSTNASNSPLAVRVFYTIAQGPVIAASPTTLTFSAVAGGANPAAQQVAISNGGGGTLSGLTASVTYAAGGPTGWLAAALGGTTAPTQLTVQPNIASLPIAADTLHATIVLKSSVAGVDSQMVAVTLQLASPVQPKLTPDTLTFNVALGTTPASQSATVTNTGAGTLGTISTGTVQWGVNAPPGWGTTPTGWLSATVSGTTVTINITSTAVPLGGQFTTAIVPVKASNASSAVNLVVHLTVTASFTQVTVGRDHACALTKSQLAYCWGDNSQHSQLGDGTTSSAWPVPVPVAGGHTFASLSAGLYHTCGILADSSAVYCWGANGSGQLGDGTQTDHNAPVLAQFPAASAPFEDLAAGGASTCVNATIDFIAYCWGANTHYQVDSLAQSPQLTPYPINTPTAFYALSAGTYHVCGTDYTGHLWCWGDNANWQLAQATQDSAVPLSLNSQVALDTTVIAAFTGPASLTSCVAETASQNVQCWGDNTAGNVGNGTSGGSVTTPAIVLLSSGSPLSSATQVSTGTFHSCAVTFGGATYCWGDNTSGELGTGGGSTSYAAQVAAPSGGFASVFASYYWTCGMGNDGRVYCWGGNTFGRLGQGTTANSATPALVKGQQ